MVRTSGSRFRHVAVPVVVLLTVIVAGQVDAGAVMTKTRRLSVSTTGAEGNAASFDNVLSATGRFLAFTSEASNLVAKDTNGYWDVFVRDRRGGITKRVSVSSDGSQGNGRSEWPSISGNGRFVAFDSEASNLIQGDTNASFDVFVRDRQTGTTRRVSKSSDGAQGDDGSYYASISADGRFVAFASDASNLVPGDTNGKTDIFVRDLEKGTTVRISRSSAGAQSNGLSYLPALSADGRFVAFVSGASTLVPNDQNAVDDIFVRDRARGTTRRVSVASDGTEADGQSRSLSISADGRFVAFASFASNLVGSEDTNGYEDVFVRDRAAHTTSRVSMNSALTIQGNGDSSTPSISADGRFVAFHSDASDLVGGQDTNGWRDVFVRDRAAGTTFRVSVNSAGTIQGNEDSAYPGISADGRFVSFQSDASDLVAGDLNGQLDIFQRGPLI